MVVIGFLLLCWLMKVIFVPILGSIKDVNGISLLHGTYYDERYKNKR